MQEPGAGARRGRLPEHDRADGADCDRALAAAAARGLPGLGPGGLAVMSVVGFVRLTLLEHARRSRILVDYKASRVFETPR